MTLLQAQAKFADDHLLAWIPSFAAEVRKMSDPCLYPQLIKTTEAFARPDRQCLNNIALWLAEEVAPTDRDAPWVARMATQRSHPMKMGQGHWIAWNLCACRIWRTTSLCQPPHK